MTVRLIYDAVVAMLLIAPAFQDNSRDTHDVHRVAQALLLKRCGGMERARIMPWVTDGDGGESRSVL